MPGCTTTRRGRMRVDEVSLGDYVLSGGEAAVLVIVEAVGRLLPGVLGNAESAAQDSFSDGLLEAPAYTKPASWRGLDVPTMCCCRAITARSPAGEPSSRGGALRSAGPTCSTDTGAGSASVVACSPAPSARFHVRSAGVAPSTGCPAIILRGGATNERPSMDRRRHDDRAVRRAPTRVRQEANPR